MSTGSNPQKRDLSVHNLLTSNPARPSSLQLGPILSLQENRIGGRIRERKLNDAPRWTVFRRRFPRLWGRLQQRRLPGDVRWTSGDGLVRNGRDGPDERTGTADVRDDGDDEQRDDDDADEDDDPTGRHAWSERLRQRDGRR